MTNGWEWVRISKRLGSSGIDSASLCSLAERYDNPICRTGQPGYIGFPIPGLHKSLKIRSQVSL